MTLYERLEDNLNDKDELTRTLLEFDYMLKLLHSNGYYIRYFDPKKIILYNGKLTNQSFSGLLDSNISEAKIKRNIWQLSKIGLMAYCNSLVDGSYPEIWVQFLYSQIKEEIIKDIGVVPEEIYEYYEEVIFKKNYMYIYDYLLQKKEEAKSNQNAKVYKLTGIYGELKENNDMDKAAFVNILFIPSLLALGYLIGLIIYIFVIK